MAKNAEQLTTCQLEQYICHNMPVGTISKQTKYKTGLLSEVNHSLKLVI